MPEKLFSSIRADADGLRARKIEFDAGLAPLQKLANLSTDSEAKRVELLAAVLESPADAKALTAFRSAVASIPADILVVNTVNARMRDLRERFDRELIPLFVDLIERAKKIILLRLRREGFAIDTRPGFTFGSMIEVGSDEVVHPNSTLAHSLHDTLRNLDQLLANRSVSPATLATVLTIIESTEV